ncbi:MAG: cysteine desulfurase family protein [Coriobacteriaceae bacterium]|nr:cysteine desulfurase family protein [Coriobacteriaceae bacterium]
MPAPSTNEPYIYADNAATTPLSPAALEAMMPFLTSEFGNPSGIHRVARRAAEALGSARARMATLLGAEHAEEMYFTSGGTESDNWVLRGAVQRFRDLHGEDATPRIITSSIEHHAILHCCAALEREGVEVTYLPVDEHGFVRPADLEAALVANEEACWGQHAPGCGGSGGSCCEADATPATALVSIMLANNEVGTIEPVRELARIARAHGVSFHTDAVQAVGHIPVDVQELGVDALSLSAHKFGGARGVGALYLREGFSIPALIAGGAQERGVRAGTENLAGIIGMVAALEESARELELSVRRVAAARDELVRHVLTVCDGAQLTGAPLDTKALPGAGPFTSLPPASSQGGSATSASTRAALTRLPSIASFTCDNVDGELLVVLLDRAGVAAATGSACSTGSTEPSHVLTAMGIGAPRAKGALRLSLSSDITREEIELLKQRVPAAIKRARLLSG